MSKELKGNIRMMSHITESTNIEVEIEKKIKVLELKTTVSGIKNLLTGLNSISEQVDKRISKFKERSLKLSRLKNRKKKE